MSLWNGFYFFWLDFRRRRKKPNYGAASVNISFPWPSFARSSATACGPDELELHAKCRRFVLDYITRALFVARWTNGRSENDTTALIFSWNRWQKMAFVCLTLRTAHLNLPLLWPFLFKASALSLNVVQQRVCFCHWTVVISCDGQLLWIKAIRFKTSNEFITITVTYELIDF
jgi:hypothetical protein